MPESKMAVCFSGLKYKVKNLAFNPERCPCLCFLSTYSKDVSFHVGCLGSTYNDRSSGLVSHLYRPLSQTVITLDSENRKNEL